MRHAGIRFSRERGQGLVEYALALTLVAAVVILSLRFLGPSVERVYCRVVTQLGTDSEQCQYIGITQANYNPSSGLLRLRATYGAGYDPSVTLWTSPGGAMHGSEDDGYYHLNVNLSGYTCPCTVTITSSRGDVATVTVGP